MRIIKLSLVVLSIWSCSQKNAHQTDVSKPSGLPGETLAKMHCASCHAFVEPNKLDKGTWQNKTLPEMGMRLGYGDVFNKNVLQVQQGAENLVNENIYPLHPVINEEDYQKIVDYYLQNAPEKPLEIENQQTVEELNHFDFKPLFTNETSRSNTTAISIHEQKIIASSPRGQFMVFDVVKNTRDSFNMTGVYSVIKPYKGELLGLDLGKIGPHEQKLGRLVKVNSSEDLLLNKLHKPTDFQFADINEDNMEDIIVCNFGFETGYLAWYDGKTKQEHIIKKLAGARNVYVQDMNQDGKKDLVVLYAQGLEGVSIFYNQSKGKFKEEQVLTFSPVDGSSWIELVDFNGDGHLDILYANGDNADYSGTLKRYHGVKIFENNGKNKFIKKYEFPMYGATKALACDFDNDGDLDIVAVAYYRAKAEENFVYLENKGNYQFTPRRFKDTYLGQWITVEVGDVNKDGKPDIVLAGHDLARPNKAGRKGVEIGVLLNKN